MSLCGEIIYPTLVLLFSIYVLSDGSITCTYKCPDGTCVDARDDCDTSTDPTITTTNIDSSAGSSNNKSRTVGKIYTCRGIHCYEIELFAHLFAGITVGSIVTAIVLVTAVLLVIARLLLHISRASTLATTVQNYHESSRPNVRASGFEIPVKLSSSPHQPQQLSLPEQQKTQFSLFDQPPAYSTVPEYSTVEPPPPYPAVKNIIPANTAHANI